MTSISLAAAQQARCSQVRLLFLLFNDALGNRYNETVPSGNLLFGVLRSATQNKLFVKSVRLNEP
jgi:hypothetical protein